MADEIQDKEPEARWINTDLTVVASFPTEVGDLQPFFSAGKRGWNCNVRLIFDQTAGTTNFEFYIAQGSLLQKIGVGTITGVTPGGKHATLNFLVPPNFDLFGVCDTGNVHITAKLLPE